MKTNLATHPFNKWLRSEDELVLEGYLLIYCHQKHALLFPPLNDQLPFLHLQEFHQAWTNFCFDVAYFSGLQLDVFLLPEVPHILSLPIHL